MFDLIRTIPTSELVDFDMSHFRRMEKMSIIESDDNNVYFIDEMKENKELDTDFISYELKLTNVLRNDTSYLEIEEGDFGLNGWKTDGNYPVSDARQSKYWGDDEKVKMDYEWLEEIADKEWALNINGVKFDYEDDWETEDAYLFEFVNKKGDKAFCYEFWKEDQTFTCTMSNKVDLDDYKIRYFGV